MSEKLFMHPVETLKAGTLLLTHWDHTDQKLMQGIYQQLEVPNWASWLAASPSSMAGRAEVFPHGQLVMLDQQEIPVASLSMNRITWNGYMDSLPSWDKVAGDPTDYKQTYQVEGDTLVMMSMNIRPDMQGKNIAKYMIESAANIAKQLGVANLTGSFRPNKFGEAKESNPHISFVKYCETKQIDSDLPIDPWLRSLVRNGMTFLKPDHEAMVVPVTMAEFNELRKTDGSWKEVAPGEWECGEVGRWYIDHYKYPGMATYIESNMWGIVKSK